PDAVALGALDELSGVGGADGRIFYFRLSAILRRYLQERFGIPAPEMTTEELLTEMARPEIGRGLAASLARFFSEAAPVTYAGRPASVDRMQADLDFARRFVRETTPAAGDAPDAGHGNDG
ncbi:hypothetical protein, partial [Desulfococcus sp.]|uniref:hypothetical protein n=1 Tax=Desulfococcus sp. TaxID=2025834 RepID=UPI0035946FC3